VPTYGNSNIHRHSNDHRFCRDSKPRRQNSRGIVLSVLLIVPEESPTHQVVLLFY
jgi:hypothetical protein